MKYHALFVIFGKSAEICNSGLLQIVGGVLRLNLSSLLALYIYNFNFTSELLIVLLVLPFSYCLLYLEHYHLHWN